MGASRTFNPYTEWQRNSRPRTTSVLWLLRGSSGWKFQWARGQLFQEEPRKSEVIECYYEVFVNNNGNSNNEDTESNDINDNNEKSEIVEEEDAGSEGEDEETLFGWSLQQIMAKKTVMLTFKTTLSFCIDVAMMKIMITEYICPNYFMVIKYFTL